MTSRYHHDMVQPPPPQEDPPPLPPGPPPPMYTFQSAPQSSSAQFSFRPDDASAPQYPVHHATLQGGSREHAGRSSNMPDVYRDPKRVRDRWRDDRRRDGHRSFEPSSRPLLKPRRAQTPDQLSTMSEERARQGRFLRAEDVSTVMKKTWMWTRPSKVTR